MPTFDCPYDVIWFYDCSMTIFSCFPPHFELATISCSRHARTPKLGRKPSYVYPIKYFIIRKFHGYSPELWQCRLSTCILWKITNFIFLPVLLKLKRFHVPGMLEPRNWVENRAMYTPFSIRAFGSFTDIIPCRDNADFRATFSGIDKTDFTTSYIITADDAVFPFRFMYF